MHRFILLAGLLVACKEADSPAIAPQSCDSAAEHLIEVCEAGTGEDFRALCEIEDPPLVSASQRRCVGGLKACSEASLESCDVGHVIIACSSHQDCPKPFSCDTDEEECVRCLADDDCDPGRGCLWGLCYDASSAFYKTFSKAAERDAGSAR